MSRAEASKRGSARENLLRALQVAPGRALHVDQAEQIAGKGYRQRVSDLREQGWIIFCQRTETGSILLLRGRMKPEQMKFAGVA